MANAIESFGVYTYEGKNYVTVSTIIANKNLPPDTNPVSITGIATTTIPCPAYNPERQRPTFVYGESNETLSVEIVNLKKYVLIGGGRVVEAVTDAFTPGLVEVPDSMYTWIETGYVAVDGVLDNKWNLSTAADTAMMMTIAAGTAYQHEFTGADADRKDRFTLNLEAAKAITAGNATAAQIAMLQRQHTACVVTEHPTLKTTTFEQFVGWMISMDEKKFLLAGAIEDLTIRMRAQLNALKANEAATFNDLNMLVAAAKADAQAEFAAITA